MRSKNLLPSIFEFLTHTHTHTHTQKKKNSESALISIWTFKSYESTIYDIAYHTIGYGLENGCHFPYPL